MEKAFCKLHTCYEMCDGGLPGEAVSVLFGGAVGRSGARRVQLSRPKCAAATENMWCHVTTTSRQPKFEPVTAPTHALYAYISSSPHVARAMQKGRPLLSRLRHMTGKFAVSSVAAALMIWGMRRLLRRRQWAKSVSCQNLLSNISDAGLNASRPYWILIGYTAALIKRS